MHYRALGRRMASTALISGDRGSKSFHHRSLLRKPYHLNLHQKRAMPHGSLKGRAVCAYQIAFFNFSPVGTDESSRQLLRATPQGPTDTLRDTRPRTKRSRPPGSWRPMRCQPRAAPRSRMSIALTTSPLTGRASPASPAAAPFHPHNSGSDDADGHQTLSAGPYFCAPGSQWRARGPTLIGMDSRTDPRECIRNIQLAHSKTTQRDPVRRRRDDHHGQSYLQRHCIV